MPNTCDTYDYGVIKFLWIKQNKQNVNKWLTMGFFKRDDWQTSSSFKKTSLIIFAEILTLIC
jgi:hypothetical protein